MLESLFYVDSHQLSQAKPRAVTWRLQTAAGGPGRNIGDWVEQFHCLGGFRGQLAAGPAKSKARRG